MDGSSCCCCVMISGTEGAHSRRQDTCQASHQTSRAAAETKGMETSKRHYWTWWHVFMSSLSVCLCVWIEGARVQHRPQGSECADQAVPAAETAAQSRPCQAPPEQQGRRRRRLVRRTVSVHLHTHTQKSAAACLAVASAYIHQCSMCVTSSARPQIVRVCVFE